MKERSPASYAAGAAAMLRETYRRAQEAARLAGKRSPGSDDDNNGHNKGEKAGDPTRKMLKKGA